VPSLLQAVSPFITSTLLDYPYVLERCTQAWRAILRVFPDHVDAAIAGDTSASVERALREGMLHALQSINEDDVRAGLEACEAVSSAFAARESSFSMIDRRAE
jgi:hypothetical protein